jgi:hypothetical protein
LAKLLEICFTSIMATAVSSSYETVAVGMRPPRVVVVFDGGGDWTYWVRRAAQLTGAIWGGAGFALVPHRAGIVAPVLLRACRAYDPDFVVTFPKLLSELKVLAGDPVSPNTGTAVHREDTELEDPEAEQARQAIIDATSPFRTQLEPGRWSDEHIALAHGRGELLAADEVSGWYASTVLTCPPHWGGLLGAAVASYAGVVDTPDPAAREPELEPHELDSVTDWLLDQPGYNLPRDLLRFPVVGDGSLTEHTPLAHRRSLAGTTEVAQSGQRRSTHLVVVGDAPEDLALARLWRAIYGIGNWLPTPLCPDIGNPPLRLTKAISTLMLKARKQGHTVLVTSTSRDRETLEQLRVSTFTSSVSGAKSPKAEVCNAADLPWSSHLPRTHYAVTDQFSSIIPIPIVHSTNGTRYTAAPMPAPLLTNIMFAGVEHGWIVDVAWDNDRSVRGKGLDGRHLTVHDEEFTRHRARNDRSGTSYLCRDYGIVFTGQPLANRLARPRLKNLSLADWVTAKLADSGLTVKPSAAGSRSKQLATMLGGRDKFVDLFAGPLLPALRAMRPPSGGYRDREGIRLDAERGCLTFQGICFRAHTISMSAVRAHLDDALTAGVLRRGLVLQCQTCEEVQFQPIGALAQRWTCQRCEDLNDLTHSTWNMPLAEPTWYYDLHQVARRMLDDHGDVPALLSAFLATQTHPDTVDEVEIHKNGNPLVEIDLISYVDDTLTVAECKSNDYLAKSKLDTREEIEKKCRAARWLRADQLIFATAQPSWSRLTANLLIPVVSEYNWGPLGPPEVNIVTGLGTSPRIKQLRTVRRDTHSTASDSTGQ